MTDKLKQRMRRREKELWELRAQLIKIIGLSKKEMSHEGPSHTMIHLESRELKLVVNQ